MWYFEDVIMYMLFWNGECGEVWEGGSKGVVSSIVINLCFC